MAAPPNIQPEQPVEGNAQEPSSLVVVDPIEHSETEEDIEARHASVLSILPIDVSVMVPIRGFRVRDLVTLEPERILTSEWSHAEDLPLVCGDVQLLWTEFEVVDQKIAARVTRLA